MMRIGEMQVRVRQRRMSMPVTVFGSRLHRSVVCVLMVLVVNVLVYMLHRFMRVLVLVPLGKVQPNAKSHQRSSQKQGHGDCFAHQNCEQGAKEWGH